MVILRITVPRHSKEWCYLSSTAKSSCIPCNSPHLRCQCLLSPIQMLCSPTKERVIFTLAPPTKKPMCWDAATNELGLFGEGWIVLFAMLRCSGCWPVPDTPSWPCGLTGINKDIGWSQLAFFWRKRWLLLPWCDVYCGWLLLPIIWWGCDTPSSTISRSRSHTFPNFHACPTITGFLPSSPAQLSAPLS